MSCGGYGSETSAKSYRRGPGAETRGGGKLQAKDEPLLHFLPPGVTGAYPSNYGLQAEQLRKKPKAGLWYNVEFNTLNLNQCKTKISGSPPFWVITAFAPDSTVDQF